jgi:O-antigen ligase
MRVRDLLTLGGFVAAGVAMLAVPHFALAVLGLVVVLALYARNALWTSAIAALVMVPMWDIFSSKPAESESIAVISQTIEAGDPLRQIAITLLLLVGLAFMVHRPPELRRVNLLVWLAVYMTIAIASLLWSQDSGLTSRRLVVAVAISVFSLGAGCVYYGRQPQGHVHLVRVICWISAAASSLILVLAILRREFHVTDTAWRLGSGGHENQLCQVAAVGFLAAVITRTRKEIWPSKAELVLAMLIPALVVLLTKSRTTWLGLIVAIVAAELCRRRANAKKLAVLLVMGSLFGILASGSSFQQVWNRGESEQTRETASGRTELWERVWPDVNKRLWLGYGFGAFWSPRTVSMEAKEWAATSAHNGYLDMVAELGLVGLAAILILVAVSSRNAWRLMNYPEYHEIGLCLLGFNIMVLVINTAESFLHDIENYPMIAFLTFSIFVSHRLSVIHLVGAPRVGLVGSKTP